MKKACWSMAAAVVLIAGSCSAADMHWSYTGEVAPAHWSEIDAAYEMCAKGMNQSPIDLTGFVEADLAPITFHYTGLATEIVNNGHTIQANYTAGSTIEAAGKIFQLKQFHFHSPSENTINGESFPLEAQFVHEAEDGSLAVVSVLFQIGEENEALARLWKQMPRKAGEKAAMASQVRAQDLMPEDRAYYRYNGSLTTPPCTEGVLWLVMKQPLTISKAQVDEFIHVMHHYNNRPVQPIHARPVLQ
ncbi:MAG TPA: carbonic anhydrase family protein [Desulfobulbaceae bacterium]|nr:carbonic anhydrase family protein [Desulfobulbaceae bacterium]